MLRTGNAAPFSGRVCVEVPEVYRARFERAVSTIEVDTGARITFLGSNRETKLLALSIVGVSEAVEQARARLNQLLLDVLGNLVVTVPSGPCTASSELYVFVDNSNIHIGAQLSHSASPGSGTEVGVPVVHVKYTELVERVEASRECRRRFVGGVMPDVVVRHWKQLGYSVRSGAQDDFGANIDDLLHAQILDTLTSAPTPGILVLMTGDGNMNSGRSSFPRCVTVALRLGWRVEMYAWRASMSICYPAFASLSQGRLTIKYLDDWRADISLRTDRLRVREGSGKAAMLRQVADGTGVGAGAGAGGPGSAAAAAPASLGASATPDATSAISAQPELPFPVVLEMAETVVKHCTALPAGGVLGSAFKAAFRAYYGRELQLKFGGQRVQLKDIMERSKVVERVIVNTQPLYRCATPRPQGKGRTCGASSGDREVCVLPVARGVRERVTTCC